MTFFYILFVNGKFHVSGSRWNHKPRLALPNIGSKFEQIG